MHADLHHLQGAQAPVGALLEDSCCKQAGLNHMQQQGRGWLWQQISACVGPVLRAALAAAQGR